MKKKLLAGLATGLLAFGMVGMAHATYMETINWDIYSIGGTINFTHTYDFSEIGPIDSVQLIIVADDVDIGEDDFVFLGATNLGSLSQLPVYDNWGYTPGAGGDTTTSVFTLDINLFDMPMPISSPGSPMPMSLLSNSMEIQFSIDVEPTWGVELQSSTLLVQGRGTEPVPEPATMLLFGTGLAGLAGYRNRRKKKA